MPSANSIHCSPISSSPSWTAWRTGTQTCPSNPVSRIAVNSTLCRAPMTFSCDKGVKFLPPVKLDHRAAVYTDDVAHTLWPFSRNLSQTSSLESPKTYSHVSTLMPITSEACSGRSSSRKAARISCRPTFERAHRRNSFRYDFLHNARGPATSNRASVDFYHSNCVRQPCPASRFASNARGRKTAKFSPSPVTPRMLPR